MTTGDIVRKPASPLPALFVALIGPLGPLLRTVCPVLTLGSNVFVWRHDDVHEVLERDPDFPPIYGPMLNTVLAGEPFILGMSRSDGHDDAAAALRDIIGCDVKARMARAADAEARRLLAAANGGIEVVAFTRAVAGKVFADDFGTAFPAGTPLDLWMMRLFEFIFAGGSTDPALVAEISDIAPRVRAGVDRLIADRKTAPRQCDVLGRALATQNASRRGTPTDVEIRTMLIGLLIGGVPQLPMAAPQALAQLLRRPDALARARAALRHSGPDALMPFLGEALRFDPLAAFLQRSADGATVLAAASGRPRRIKAGAEIKISPLSAMRDGRRIPAPGTFDETRDNSNFAHFSHGLHRCFGQAMVEGLLPAILAPLIERPGLRAAGKLQKRGVFAHALHVEW